MVREANRGAVIPTAGGERGLGQGWVCGGQIPPPFQFSDSNTDDWDNRPYLWESLRLKVKMRKRIGPGAGVRGPHLLPLCPKTYARSFPRVGIVRFRAPALVPLCPKTYARSFPRVEIVRFRAPAFTALNQSGFEHGRLGQSSLPSLRLAFIGIACGRFSEYNFLMSLHRSLRSGGSTAAKRNVLKRFERVTLLKKRGQWKAGMKSTGLPKTKPE